jgi:hypothetical protein
MSRFVGLLAAGGLLLLACAGQQAARGPAERPPEVLTPQAIISLSQQGVPPQEIIGRIDRSGAVYVLRAADVSRLQAAGVSNEVIDHMLTSCLRASCSRASVKDSLWYRQGQFYAPPPFPAYQGAYRFGD